MIILPQLKRFLFSNNKRTVLVHKNIIWSFLIKGWSGIVMLLSIPISIACLGEYKNGVWMTIATFLLWIDSFDIGLGNGMRNQLATYLAKDEKEKARECVSTTFFMLILIIIPVLILLLLLANQLNWYHILNVSPQKVHNLPGVLYLSFSLVCTTFIFKFVGNVYMALQLPAINNALVVSGQTLALLATIVILITDKQSLFLIATANTLMPLIVYLVAYPLTFRRFYPQLAPSIRLFNKNSLHALFSLGINFFILQIAAVVLVTMSNVIISHVLSPQMVTPYQVVLRYFSLLTMVFTVIATPYWSATTDAYAKNDYDWIKHSMFNIRRIVAILIIAAVIMVIIAPFVYQLWVGVDICIPSFLSLSMAVYFSLIIVSTSYSYFLYGFGVLRLQLIFTTGAMISFPILGYLLCKEIGIIGVILALIITQLPGAICNMVQYHKIVNGCAKGIWIK